MYARQINSEESNAIREIGNALNQQKPDRSYKAKQKIFGAFCLVSSIAAIALLKSDAALAYAFLMIPMGLVLICTKEKVIW